LHRDALGSVEAITDGTLAVRDRQSYDLYGKQRNLNWTASTGPFSSVLNLGFAGHERLDAIGLVDMGARLFDPAIGQMLSADAAQPTSDNPQSYNRYSYAFNNPASYIDPSGNAPCPPDDDCDGALVNLGANQ